MTSQIGILEKFDDANDEFELYIERLEQYFIVNATAQEQKAAILLSNVGAKTYKLIRNLLQPTLPSTVTYDELVSRVAGYYKPKCNTIAERFRFNKRNQNPDESIMQYIVELKRLAATCDFQNFLDQALRDRLVCGTRQDAIQKRLLSKRDLTFADACDIAESMELADKNVSDMNPQTADIKAVFEKHLRIDGKTKKKYSDKLHSSPIPENIKCYRCGGNHFASNCKHMQSRCAACKKMGHLAKVCRSTQTSTTSQKHRLNTKMVRQESASAEEDSEDDFTLYAITHQGKSIVDYTIRVSINGRALDMILDTAADVSIVGEKWFMKNIKGVVIKPQNFHLRDYNTNPVKIVGTAKVRVSCHDREEKIDITLVEGDKPALFGKDFIKAFEPSLHEWLNTRATSHHAKIAVVVEGAAPVKELMTALTKKYSNLFAETKEPIRQFMAKIELKSDAKPVFRKARPVPFALKNAVEKQIKKSQEEGVWKFVDHSSWATPLVIVPKKDNRIRLCGDFKITVNPHSEPECYTLPTQKELFATLNGGVYFSKLDLRQAYQQVELDDASKQLLTLNTHMGLVRPERLLYGVNSASQIFQSIMDRILSGIQGIICYQDDILVTSASVPEHLTTLENVFARLQKFNVHLNQEKCHFMQNQMEYLGHRIDKTGIHPTDEKVKAINTMSAPRNTSELRTFIGMFNYYIKFIRNAADMLHPLYRLLHKGEAWNWSKECEHAFEKCKGALTSDMVLVHYNENKRITLACDASPFGLGAVISHVESDGTERPIAYASRTLSKAEAAYSHMEREGLAIVYGLKHFQQYLYGRRFTIVTDHKPLISLFGPKTGIPTMAAARIQRWALLLASFQYDIVYKKGVDHTNVDTLSRCPLPNQGNISAQCYALSFLEHLPTTDSDIKAATERDPILSTVMNRVKYGWTDIVGAEFQPFNIRRDQLSVDNGCLLWGMRVVIPKKHQRNMLELLHDTHPGVVKMKAIARSHIWWPNIDKDIEEMANSCSACKENQNMPATSPLQSWVWPRSPWDRIHIDFAQKGNAHFLIVVDANSKWLEVKQMQSTTTSQTVDNLRKIFASYGIPREIVSDNGPQFTSEEFARFLQIEGIRHTLVPPYHPSSNGSAERYVQSFKKALEKMNSDREDRTSLSHRISRYLLAQHSTPHTTTGQTPAMLFLGREVRTKLTLIHGNVAAQVEKNQFKQKVAHDRAHKREHAFGVGDPVTVRNQVGDPRWLEGTIVGRNSSKTWKVLTDKGEKHLHCDQMKPTKHPEDKNPVAVDTHTENSDAEKNTQQSSTHQDPQDTAPSAPRRNPSRHRKPPDRLNL